MQRRTLLQAIAGLITLPARAAITSAIEPMLAEVYDPGVSLDFSDWWISEKYDGVRALWTGRELLSRSGRAIATPTGFTADWPAEPLDGELWLGRGRFEETSGIVRRDVPDAGDWQTMRYQVFDLPAHGGSFDQRLRELRRLEPRGALQAVPHFRVDSSAALHTQLQRVVAQGGEGLMLHRASSTYSAGRSGDLLKLKPHLDAEAVVTAHLPGKGKYQGQLGALEVQRADGRRFRIGTGLSDAQRSHPPTIGSVVTYQYDGLTESGLPRFARLLRVHVEP